MTINQHDPILATKYIKADIFLGMPFSSNIGSCKLVGLDDQRRLPLLLMISRGEPTIPVYDNRNRWYNRLWRLHWFLTLLIVHRMNVGPVPSHIMAPGKHGFQSPLSSNCLF